MRNGLVLLSVEPTCGDSCVHCVRIRVNHEWRWRLSLSRFYFWTLCTCNRITERTGKQLRDARPTVGIYAQYFERTWIWLWNSTRRFGFFYILPTFSLVRQFEFTVQANVMFEYIYSFLRPAFWSFLAKGAAKDFYPEEKYRENNFSSQSTISYFWLQRPIGKIVFLG